MSDSARQELPDLMALADKYVERARAVAAGERPCNVSEYRAALASAIQALREQLAEARANEVSEMAPVIAFVCRRRKVIATIDATNLLWRFARKRALSVIHLWDAPDVVREYLETGREDLRAAARAAALAAASPTAGDAEWNAVRAAVWAIADAENADVWVAASIAARAAAWAADAARLLIAQEREEFLAMVEEAFASLLTPANATPPSP